MKRITLILCTMLLGCLPALFIAGCDSTGTRVHVGVGYGGYGGYYGGVAVDLMYRYPPGAGRPVGLASSARQPPTSRRPAAIGQATLGQAALGRRSSRAHAVGAKTLPQALMTRSRCRGPDHSNSASGIDADGKQPLSAAGRRGLLDDYREELIPNAHSPSPRPIARRLIHLRPSCGAAHLVELHRRPHRRRLDGPLDVRQDPLDLRPVQDEGDDPQRLTASRARERQTLVDPRQQQGPAVGGEATDGAPSFVGVDCAG